MNLPPEIYIINSFLFAKAHFMKQKKRLNKRNSDQKKFFDHNNIKIGWWYF
jgi:hypothetical protein